ncbi:PilW family protein [Cupriavidus pauculus]|uniref:PilW family protein n=1 Tax=Cupriavidus pauculus TaxID=82633 RepID=UPI001EE27D18|nr:PilW family protein [Cupriavidus pauculus]GJG96623.1 prepilin-type N-terminal cleavage/methylation domain-containing protein [Cupriavidus pauculus]
MKTRPNAPHLAHRRDAGFTLVELMVTLVISLLVLMAGLSFYMMSRSSYETINDSANLEERGNFALSIVTRLMRQTAYVPVVPNTGGMMYVPDPMIVGIDNCSNPNNSETLACGAGGGINASDAIIVRYFGVGQQADQSKPDESVVDCSGQGVASYTDSDKAASQRGLSILYIGNGANGKPSLMCKYRERAASGVETTDTYQTQELVPGVENLQLLYGMSTNGDDVPDKYVTGTGITTDADWRNVKTVKVAMIVRADSTSADAGAPAAISLFGPLYSGDNATYTPTVDVKSARKLYYATIQIRNYQTCGGMSC